MATGHKRLGELLIEAKLLSHEQINRAIAEQKKNGQLLGATLIGMGLITEQDLMGLLQRQLGLPLVDLDSLPVDEAAVAKVKEDMARKYLALPSRSRAGRRWSWRCRTR